mmetsp:Transcript_9656/g.30419  ORF Transcript_9656/g.30419 Transcript_9656/m.30419 type:complete len:327 (-) Transcript_9656:187-1167(-)
MRSSALVDVAITTQLRATAVTKVGAVARATQRPAAVMCHVVTALCLFHQHPTLWARPVPSTLCEAKHTSVLARSRACTATCIATCAPQFPRRAICSLPAFHAEGEPAVRAVGDACRQIRSPLRHASALVFRRQQVSATVGIRTADGEHSVQRGSVCKSLETETLLVGHEGCNVGQTKHPLAAPHEAWAAQRKQRCVAQCHLHVVLQALCAQAVATLESAATLLARPALWERLVANLARRTRVTPINTMPLTACVIFRGACLGTNALSPMARASVRSPALQKRHQVPRLVQHLVQPVPLIILIRPLLLLPSRSGVAKVSLVQSRGAL